MPDNTKLYTLKDPWYITETGGGSSIVEYSSFIGYQYSNESALPTKPVEQGAFITANKWKQPYEVEVELAKHGTAAEIKAFLEGLEEYRDGISLVDVVTPSRVFTRANIYAISYSWSMDENGPRMVIPKISLREVMFTRSSTSSTEINSPQNASCSSTQPDGERTCSQVEGLR